MTGYENMNFPDVTAMLGTAFWSSGIERGEVEQGARNSALLVGAFSSDGRQIGYARVISDKTRFAYICDVIVEEGHRRMGIAQGMMRRILEGEELKDVYQWLLITRDAHGVYEKLGFSALQRQNDWMEIRHTRPKR